MVIPMLLLGAVGIPLGERERSRRVVATVSPTVGWCGVVVTFFLSVTEAERSVAIHPKILETLIENSLPPSLSKNPRNPDWI
jgi:hypothetical protein